MKFSFGQLALASCVAAAPTALEARAAAITDIDILNFALTLEHLEAAFYKEGLKKFGKAAYDKAGYVARTRFNIREIYEDEATHVSFLTDVIKSLDATPVKACKYDFGLTDVNSFVDTASVLEGVGVTAYLGAAALISNKGYLTPAGSILTVEARHNTYIRDNHQPGPRSPFPQAFDVPLTPNEVYTLASAFIVSCPMNNPTLPVKAFPKLTPTSSKLAKAGDVVTFKVGKKVDLKKPLFASFASVTGPVFTPVKIDGQNVKITIPKKVYGQSYVILSDSKNISDNSTLAGPAIVEIQTKYASNGFPM